MEIKRNDYCEKIREKHPSAYEPWTEEEDRQLIEEVNSGQFNNRELAAKQKRTPGAIKSRIKKLRKIGEDIDKTFSQSFENDNKYDQYGNNTNFSDGIMSDMTTKGLLGKWTALIESRVRCDIRKYYMKTRNIDAGDKNWIKSFFKDTMQFISYLTPILEDLVHKNIYGMEDIFIAVYGIQSDEVYLLREFLDLYKRMDEWDEDYMWNDCETNSRLYDIFNVKKVKEDARGDSERIKQMINDTIFAVKTIAQEEVF